MHLNQFYVLGCSIFFEGAVEAVEAKIELSPRGTPCMEKFGFCLYCLYSLSTTLHYLYMINSFISS